MKYTIYTDGATSNNGYANSRGGWAFIKVDEAGALEAQNGYVENATNNICELTAVIKACKTIKETDECIIYSDSAYIINCYKNKWWVNWERNGWINSKKEPVANQNLWKILIPYFKDSRFSFEKVKGHDVNGLDQHSYWNNQVDKLAVEAKSLI